MGLTAAELMIKISADLSELGKTLEQGESQIAGMAKATKKSGAEMEDTFAGIKKNWLAITAAAYGAERALSAVWAMGKRGAEFEESTERLNRQLQQFGTNASAMTAKLADLVGGQLSLEEATRLSSKALAAGFNPAQIETMTRMAEILSDLSGGDVASGFETINQALVTGRDVALKSLGIHIDLDQEVQNVAKSFGLEAAALSEAEKFQIRLNAVMREAPELFAKYRTAVKSHADELTATEKDVDNLTLAFSKLAAMITTEVVGALAAYGKARAGLSAAAPLSVQDKIDAAHAASTGGAVGTAPLSVQDKIDAAHAASTGGAVGTAPSGTKKAAAGGLSPDVVASLAAKQASFDHTDLYMKNVEAERALNLIRLDTTKANADARLHAEVEAMLAEDEARRASMDVQVEAYGAAAGRIQEERGRRIVAEETASQQIRSFWTGQAEDMLRSNVFSLSQITTSFNTSFAQWAVMGTSWAGFWQQLQVTALSASLQFLEQAVVQSALTEAAKTSAAAAGAAQRVGIATAEAGTTTSIFAGMTTAIYGMVASVGAAIAAVGAAIMATLVSVGQFVVGMLGAIAAALKISVFGIPAGVLVAAGAAVLAGYLASQGNVMGAIMVGVGGLLAGAGGLGAFSGAGGAESGLGGLSGADAGVPMAAEGAYVSGPNLMMVGEGRQTETILPFDIRDVGSLGGEQHFYIIQDGRQVAHTVLRHQPRVAYLHGM